jgi:DNA-binding HxlR family transcriptional regulator
MSKILVVSKIDDEEKNALKKSFSLVGDEWNLLIIQVLLDEPRRFNDIKRLIPHINNRTLSARLKSLMEYGVLGRKVEAGSPPFALYYLTALGKGVKPVIEAIEDFGDTFLG